MNAPDIVGNYGALRFLKKNGEVLTSYPVDDDEVTFGRRSSSDIRLYYPWVDPLHCKLVFEDRKAMLMVYGATGVVIDDCHVLPTQTGQPATVPLNNGSHIVMNTKRFVFEYPPKELRPALIATPRPSPRKTRRALRVSVIQSAHVFSPLRGAAVATTPAQQAAALTSPVRPFARDLRDEEDVVLVEGAVADAVVLEDGRDLIVLEEVDLKPEPEPEPAKHFPASPTPLGRVPQTPQFSARRRSNFNLHKAVLLRSAQRAMEQSDDRDEENEVELAVSPERELGPVEEEGEEPERERGEAQPVTRARSPFQAGLDVIRSVFGGKANDNASTTNNNNDQENDDEHEDDDDSDHDAMDEDDAEADVVLDYGRADGAPDDDNKENTTTRFPPIQSGGQHNPFLTPQPVSRRSDMGGLTGPRRVRVDGSQDGAQPRFSLTGPQRVRIVEPWKISQIETDASLATQPPTQSAGPVGQPAQPSDAADEEDTQVVVDRLKGKAEELRRKSLARRERNSVGGRGLFDLAPLSSPVRREISPTREPLAKDVQMDSTTEQDPPKETATAQPVASLYPNLPSVDFLSRPRSPTKTIPATPRFTGVRELFKAPADPVGAHTPAVSSVRELFKLPEIRQVPPTPALEAASAMFASVDTIMESEEEESTSGRISPAPGDGPSNKAEPKSNLPRPASRLARFAPTSSSSSADEGNAKRLVTSKTAVRSVAQTRRRTPEPGSSSDAAIPARTTRANASKSQAPAEPSEAEDESVLEVAAKPTRATRARTPVSKEAEVVAEPKPRTTRTAAKTGASASGTRSRRAAPASGTDDSDVPKKTKTAGKPAASRNVADKENDESSEQDAKPKRRVASKSSSSDVPAQAPASGTTARVTRARARK